jgi:multidrug efflux pump subunit AcrA (membrane-fusion protein)
MTTSVKNRIASTVVVVSIALNGPPLFANELASTTDQAAFNDAKVALARAEANHFEAAQQAEDAAIAYQHAQETLRAARTALETARINLAHTQATRQN